MYKIVLPKTIDRELIARLIEMDHAAFPQEDWVARDEAELIYTSKQDCLSLLYQNTEPIGVVTAFLLGEKTVREAVEKDTPIYKLLNQTTLSDESGDLVYLHCFLLLPEHRNRDLVYALYKGLEAWLGGRARAFAFTPRPYPKTASTVWGGCTSRPFTSTRAALFFKRQQARSCLTGLPFLREARIG